MKISYWPYKLYPKNLLNAKSNSLPRQGCLLKWAIKDAFGYSDLHPWPELGDLPLDIQLDELKQGKYTPLLKRSQEIATIDAKFRAESKSAFEGLTIPPSHWLCTDISELTHEILSDVLGQGYTIIKIKIGRNFAEEALKLCDLASFSNINKIKIRLDANESLSYNQFSDFLDQCRPIHRYIDFIEDPCPYQPQQWQNLQQRAPLAADRSFLAAYGNSQTATTLVIKPALSDVLHPSDTQRHIITTYLDHPLGQAAACYYAAKFTPNEINGLLSHHCYLSNEFSKCLVNKGPYLLPPSGTGFGFDHLLKELSWIPL